MLMLDALHAAIEAVAPIDGVSVGSRSDKGTWRVSFKHEATDDQKAAAASVVAAFDINAPTARNVIAERERRLALGFDYDFGDVRGVHRIGTTKNDLEGWDEVSKYAGALIDAGQTSTTIHIATDTGPCTVTPIEWRAVEIASAQYRQPLWAKSFALMASNPIPADYTNDSYWA